MTVTVTESKAKCLNLIERVHKYGNAVIITKHGSLWEVATLAGLGR
jgi:antitoxin (DNA-binding transcriptional repressor) of toxin-antitoxin stability system